MQQVWFAWSGWVFGLVGAIGVIITWVGLTQRKTTNTVKNGNLNDQAGGDGQTSNTVEAGNKNKQRGA